VSDKQKSSLVSIMLKIERAFYLFYCCARHVRGRHHCDTHNGMAPHGGMMEDWNTGLCQSLPVEVDLFRFTCQSFFFFIPPPLIPVFHYSNIPVVKRRGAKPFSKMQRKIVGKKGQSLSRITLFGLESSILLEFSVHGFIPFLP
jgi:hypothetical protein